MEAFMTIDTTEMAIWGRSGELDGISHVSAAVPSRDAGHAVITRGQMESHDHNVPRFQGVLPRPPCKRTSNTDGSRRPSPSPYHPGHAGV